MALSVPRGGSAGEQSWEEAAAALRHFLASASSAQGGGPGASGGDAACTPRAKVGKGGARAQAPASGAGGGVGPRRDGKGGKRGKEGKEGKEGRGGFVEDGLQAHKETLLRRVADPDASIGSRRVCVEYILELTRHERPGHISTRLLARLLQALLSEDGCHPDVWAKFLDSAASHWDLSAASLNSLRGLCTLHLAQQQPGAPGAPSAKGPSSRAGAASGMPQAAGAGGVGEAAGEAGGVQAGDVLSFLHSFSLRLMPALQPGVGSTPQRSSQSGAEGDGDGDEFGMDSDEEGGAGPEDGPAQSSTRLLHSFWVAPQGASAGVQAGGRGDAAGVDGEAEAETQGSGKKRKGAVGHAGVGADLAGRRATGPQARLARLRGGHSGQDSRGQVPGNAAAGGAQNGAPSPLDVRAGKDAKDGKDVKERAREVRRQLGAAWMALLRCRLPRSVVRAAVVRLHDVIPLLPKPLLLADVLSACYKMGGDLAVRALGALFRLMTEHGLEYPQYYQQLYAVLGTLPALFVARAQAQAAHRSRFVELLDASLSSPLLPAYIAGAFSKRLARLSLRGPTPLAVATIALLHNLLRRHPSITKLVQRGPAPRGAPSADGSGPPADNSDDSDSEQQEPGAEGPPSSGTPAASQGQPEAGGGSCRAGGAGLWGGVDPFLPDEEKLEECRALESSLWEVDCLRKHYAPAVSRFAASLEADLTQRRRTADVRTGTVASSSFEAIFAEEQERKIRGVPLAYHSKAPASLFSSSVPSLRELREDSAGGPPAKPSLEALGWQV